MKSNIQIGHPLPAELKIPIQSSHLTLINQNTCYWCHKPIPENEMGGWCSSTCKSQDEQQQKLNGGW